MPQGFKNPDAAEQQSLREGKVAFCQICFMDWPESTFLEQDGLRVSKLCCWEPRGGRNDRDEAVTKAAELAATLQTRSAFPSPYMGRNDGLTALPAVTSIAPNPIVVSRGGAAVPATLTGVNLSGSDTVAYGSAGITNAVPPTVDSATQITLSVQASGGTAAGFYDLTFNTTPWRAVVKVI